MLYEERLNGVVKMCTNHGLCIPSDADIKERKRQGYKPYINGKAATDDAIKAARRQEEKA